MGVRQGPGRPPLPLLRNEEVIEAPADQNTLTRRYTDEVIKFIRENRDKPFFVYLPHTMPHNPVHASDEFRDSSANGRYGDCVEEIDWSAGQILAALKALDLDEQTLVLFTSDNGAASRWGGGNGPLRGWKGSTWEGGMREPCIVRWPGTVPAGTACNELACSMDLMPTFAALAGTTAPTDRIIDGKDIRPLLMGRSDAKSPHEAFYYYQMDQLQAVRSGKWKLHLPLKPKKRNWGKPEPEGPLLLFDLDADIGEKTNVADQHPDVVERLTALAEQARADLGDTGRPGKNQRPAGFVENPKPLVMTTR
jgi:arylsulfatase A-like enzyme